MNSLHMTCPNPDELIGAWGAGSRIRIQSSATQTGTYADVAFVVLVSLQTAYAYEHVAGIDSTWYKVRFEDSTGANANDYGAPFQSGDATSAYASIAAFRSFTRNQYITDAADPDTFIESLALATAARAIDAECRRTFQLAGTAPATARIYSAVCSTDGYGRYSIEMDDVADPSSITVSFDSSGNGDYTSPCVDFRVGPSNAAAKGLPYRELVFDLGVIVPYVRDGVQVTAPWGWAAWPPTITLANLIQASRFLKRRDAPFGVAGSPDMGSEIRLLAKLDPDVALMVDDYKIWAVG